MIIFFEYLKNNDNHLTKTKRKSRDWAGNKINKNQKIVTFQTEINDENRLLTFSPLAGSIEMSQPVI